MRGVRGTVLTGTLVLAGIALVLLLIALGIFMTPTYLRHLLP